MLRLNYYIYFLSVFFCLNIFAYEKVSLNICEKETILLTANCIASMDIPKKGLEADSKDLIINKIEMLKDIPNQSKLEITIQADINQALYRLYGELYQNKTDENTSYGIESFQYIKKTTYLLPSRGSALIDYLKSILETAILPWFVIRPGAEISLGIDLKTEFHFLVKHLRKSHLFKNTLVKEQILKIAEKLDIKPSEYSLDATQGVEISGPCSKNEFFEETQAQLLKIKAQIDEIFVEQK